MVRQAKKADIPDWTTAEADNFVKGEVASPCKKRKELEDTLPKKADEETSSGEDDPQKTSRAQQYLFKRDSCFLFVFVLRPLTKHQDMFMYTSASSTGAKLNSSISSCS